MILPEHQAAIATAIAKGVDYDALNRRFFGTRCVLRKLKDIKLFQNLMTEGVFDLPVDVCAYFIRWGFTPSDWKYYADAYELAHAVMVFTETAHRIDPVSRVQSISSDNFLAAANLCGIKVETTPSGCNTKFRMQPVNRAALRIATGNILEDYS